MADKMSKDIKKAGEQFDEFEKQVKDLTLDQMNKAPKEEQEPQTKLSQKEIQKIPDFYLKPSKTFPAMEKFNEKYRSDWNFSKEYVHITAEHRELIGEKIEMWTRPFAGVPAEYWEIPTNRPVWVPRHVAERIRNCTHHRLSMADPLASGSYSSSNYVGGSSEAGFYGKMVVDSTVNRLNANPVSDKKSIFMGASGF